MCEVVLAVTLSSVIKNIANGNIEVSSWSSLSKGFCSLFSPHPTPTLRRRYFIRDRERSIQRILSWRPPGFRQISGYILLQPWRLTICWENSCRKFSDRASTSCQLTVTRRGKEGFCRVRNCKYVNFDNWPQSPSSRRESPQQSPKPLRQTNWQDRLRRQK